MKKRLLGFILLIFVLLGFSVVAYADLDLPPYPSPRPPRSISIELNEANELGNVIYKNNG